METVFYMIFKYALCTYISNFQHKTTLNETTIINKRKLSFLKSRQLKSSQISWKSTNSFYRDRVTNKFTDRRNVERPSSNRDLTSLSQKRNSEHSLFWLAVLWTSDLVSPFHPSPHPQNLRSVHRNLYRFIQCCHLLSVLRFIHYSGLHDLI